MSGNLIGNKLNDNKSKMSRRILSLLTTGLLVVSSAMPYSPHPSFSISTGPFYFKIAHFTLYLPVVLNLGCVLESPGEVLRH